MIYKKTLWTINAMTKDADKKPTKTSITLLNSVEFSGNKLEFPAIIAECKSILSSNETVNYSTLDLKHLTQQFNAYLNELAQKSDNYGLWSRYVKSKDGNENIFAGYVQGNTEPKFALAFVAQYKESAILRRLFHLDNKQNFSRFDAFEKPSASFIKNNENSEWAKLATIGTQSQIIINQFKKFNEWTEMGEKLDANAGEILLSLIDTFEKAVAEIEGIFAGLSQKTEADNSIFYPMDDEVLYQYTGHQLATICFEDFHEKEPTPLIVRIIMQDELWDRMNEVLKSGDFNAIPGNSMHKIDTLTAWRSVAHQVGTINTENFSRVVEQLKKSQKLADEYNDIVKKEITTLSGSIENLEKALQVQKQLITQFNTTDEVAHANLIKTKLIPLTKAYQMHLIAEGKKVNKELNEGSTVAKWGAFKAFKSDEANYTILMEKFETICNLLDILENTEKNALPSKRVAAFSKSIAEPAITNTLYKERNPEWINYLKNCCIALAVICTGVIPALIYSYINAEGPSFFTKPKGGQFADRAAALTKKTDPSNSTP